MDFMGKIIDGQVVLKLNSTARAEARFLKDKTKNR
jgi:hypothetical protein